MEISQKHDVSCPRCAMKMVKYKRTVISYGDETIQITHDLECDVCGHQYQKGYEAQYDSENKNYVS